MNDEQLKKLWQTSNADKDLFTINPPKIITEMNTKVQQFEKDIKKRNKLETAVAILLIPIEFFIAFTTPNTLSKIGAILLIFASLWIVYYLKNNSTKKIKTVDMQASLKEQLQNHKRQILHEKRNSENVFVWYILPVLPGMILFFAGFGIDSGFYFRLVGLLIIVIGIYFLNKKAANEMKPLIEEIDKSIKHLDSKN